jgi:hypothetical protein
MKIGQMKVVSTGSTSSQMEKCIYMFYLGGNSHHQLGESSWHIRVSHREFSGHNLLAIKRNRRYGAVSGILHIPYVNKW